MDSDVYDGDMMSRTLRGLKFVHASRRVPLRRHVLEEIDGTGRRYRRLEAIYKCGEGPAWYVTFTTSAPVERLGDVDLADGHDGMRSQN